MKISLYMILVFIWCFTRALYQRCIYIIYIRGFVDAYIRFPRLLPLWSTCSLYRSLGLNSLVSTARIRTVMYPSTHETASAFAHTDICSLHAEITRSILYMRTCICISLYFASITKFVSLYISAHLWAIICAVYGFSFADHWIKLEFKTIYIR